MRICNVLILVQHQINILFKTRERNIINLYPITAVQITILDIIIDNKHHIICYYPSKHSDSHKSKSVKLVIRYRTSA